MNRNLLKTLQKINSELVKELLIYFDELGVDKVKLYLTEEPLFIYGFVIEFLRYKFNYGLLCSRHYLVVFYDDLERDVTALEYVLSKGTDIVFETELKAENSTDAYIEAFKFIFERVKTPF